MTDKFGIRLTEEGAGVTAPLGFVVGAACGGIKSSGDDVALIYSRYPAVAAAVFTRNLVKAAPVQLSAKHARHPSTRAIVVNAGNANCCTGERGLADAQRMCELAAARVGCAVSEVLVCSTGIIGHPLPMEKVQRAIESIELSEDSDTSARAARAVMTTDTRPKYCAASAQIDGRIVSVGGQAKGVGMIGPDMGPATLHATLLAFLTTDAAVEKPLLQEVLQGVVERSFNSVTVDGDTSTNDTAILLANGASGVSIDGSNLDRFTALVEKICVHLSRLIAADGEGATKLIEIRAEGLATAADAKTIAMTVANSPLVKTAIFGGDPNWGRIAAAAGRAGVSFDPRRLSIVLGRTEVFANGEPTHFELSQAQAEMQGDQLDIVLRFEQGDASWTCWTCDFSYDYVKINAEYHT